MDALLRELVLIVGPTHVLTSPDQRATYEVDWTGRFRGHTPAVVRPASTDELVAIIDACRRTHVAIVPQGGNTGLVGGGVPLGDEIVVSLRRLTTVGAVDTSARQVTVGAGVTLADVQNLAAAAGLRYAVDLSARDSATIGGMIATNAGGINMIRYGGTREQVIGVEAVLGSGQIVSRLGGLLKDNTGYHFPSLLCGSEGTLGIVTAARLRLVTQHAHRATALVAFRTVVDAVAAVSMWRSHLDTLEAAELFLDAGLQLVCRAFDLSPPFTSPWPVYVLVEAADHVDPTEALGRAVEASSGMADVAVAGDEKGRRALWRYREDHTLAINTLGPPHKLDVTLPIDRLAEFMKVVPKAVSEVDRAAQTWLFGHVGDGNIHVNITGVGRDDERTDERVLTYVCELGGSISAEHGIGTAKKQWLHLNRSPAELSAMRAIKVALDPVNILNPNVLFA